MTGERVSPPAAEEWKRTFAFAFAAQILGIVGFSFATPFLPFFISELGVVGQGRQAFWAGIALSSAGFTFALFAPVWGVLADRYGRKRMVCRALFGGCCSLLLMSFARTVPQLLLCRVFQGAFSGTLAASIAMVAAVVPHRRSGLALGMMQTAVSIGNCVGPFIGGMAADALGYRGGFRIGALLTLSGGLLVLAGVRESFTPPKAGARRGPGFRAILLLPGFVVGVIVLFAVRLSNSIANPSFPLIVREIIGPAPNLNSVAGSVIAAAAVASAAAAAILGHAGDRIGRRRVLVACCVGASAASVGQFFVRELPVLFAVRVLFGFSVAGMLPSANAMIHAVVDRRSMGKAYGLATSLSMLGNAIGPTVGGTLAMAAGLRVPFLVTAAAHILLAAMLLLLLRDRLPAARGEDATAVE